MIVDDDKEFGDVLVRKLQLLGIHADFHHGPFGTVNAIRKGDYDLVILDVRMPALEGPRIAELLKNRKGMKEPKIILLSALNTEELRHVAAGIGVQAYISKRSPMSEILKTIVSVLGPPS